MIRRTDRARLLLGAGLIIAACGGDSTGPEQPPVVAGPASLAIVASPATSIRTNAPLEPAPVIELRDDAGKPVARAGVAITATLAGGKLAGTTTATTGSSGRATFTGLTASAPPGTHELSFSSTGLASASLTLTITPNAVAGMTAASPLLQNGTVAAPVGSPPRVRLVDADGNPVPGASVQFAVISGDGTISVPAPVTDANGTASAGAWTLGAAVGTNVVRAVAGADTVVFRAGGASLPVRSIAAASRLRQTIVVSQELTEQPAARLLGSGGAPVEGALVIFSGTSGAAAIDDSISVTDADGIARARHWKVRMAGPHRLFAVAPSSSLDSLRFDVSALQKGALAAASGWTADQIVVAGTAASGQPGVLVTSDGNPQPDVLVTFSASDGGTLGHASAVSGADGIARLDSWTLGSTLGRQVLTASAPGFNPGSIEFSAYAVGALPVTLTIVAGDQQTVTASHDAPVDPAVKLSDANADPLAGYPVRFTALQGRIADSLANTNSEGVATGGHWTMPEAVLDDAQLQVSVPLAQGSPLVFHATSSPGVPARIEYNADMGKGVAGRSVGAPSIHVYDASDIPLQQIPVTATVTLGGGSVSHDGFTGQGGLWQAEAWILDTITGRNELTVSVPGLAPVTFFAVGVGGSATAMTIVDGNAQTGTIFSPLSQPVSVRLTDRYGNSTSDQGVNFSSSGDGSFLPGYAYILTDTNGVASVTWRLGSTPGSYTLTATSGEPPGITQTITATAMPVTSAFDIEVRYIGTPSAAMQSAIDAAVARWRAIVTGDLADATLNRAAAECFENQPAINETVDDLLIYVETDAIDGVGGILGAAGPCLIRSDGRLSSMGYMHLDAADVAYLSNAGQLRDVVLHEMGHILGIGSLWEDRGLVQDSGTADPRYNGIAGVQGYHDLGGLSTTVPLENTGGPGTAESHWREATFGTELMTGYIAGSDNALTRMSIGALEDLGYSVSYVPSEPLAVSAGALAQLRARPRRLLERTLPSPIIVVDHAGREVGRERRLR